jgi:hypothetical protein
MGKAVKQSFRVAQMALGKPVRLRITVNGQRRSRECAG